LLEVLRTKEESEFEVSFFLWMGIIVNCLEASVSKVFQQIYE
jgi:hypothetical protein